MPKLEFQVVINHEEQYSIWPIGRPVGRGWRPAGTRGSKEACLRFIEEVWTDMRPKDRKDLDDLLRKL